MANIFSQLIRPVRSMQEYGQDMDTAESNKLTLAANRMKAQQDQQGMADDAAVRSAYQAGGDENAIIKTLRGGGQYKAADALQKQIGERAKSQADAAKSAQEVQSKKLADAEKRLQIAGQAFGYVKDNPSAESAASVVQHLQQNGIWDDKQVAAAMAEIQANPTPEGVRMLATRAFQGVLDAKEQLPKYFQQGRGSTAAIVGVSPVSGAAQDVQSAPIAQSEAQRLQLEQQAREAALNRGVQVRGQNMVDSRARDTAAATMSKPFEVTGPDGNPVLVQQDKQGNITPVSGYKPKGGAEKPLNDTQSKALLFGSRMREAGKVLDELAKSGTTTSVPGSRSGYGIGPVVTALSSTQKQQLDQAKRDFVNAVLRRESGAVIADSEFENADKQYFPQIGDSKEVVAQKKRNRELATNGILQEVPENRRSGLQPQAQMPTADDVRKQADNILKGG